MLMPENKHARPHLLALRANSCFATDAKDKIIARSFVENDEVAAPIGSASGGGSMQIEQK